jgi:hypothetical protein
MRKMNHILFRSARLLPAVVLLAGTTLLGQDHTEKRSVSKRFPVSRESTLEVMNKYGKIQVVTWDRNEVTVDVDIILTESNPSKLRKLKEDISIDFTATGNYIIARTRIESESGRIASELKSVSHTISGSNKQVEINYLVRIPEYLDVVLQNKFGDIYLDNLKGQVDIELSNGALKTGQLEGSTSMTLSFASGMVKSLGSSSMKLLYSDMTVGDAGQLELESKSSTVHADSVNVLKIESRRDKLHFKRVEYFFGNSNFSQVRIYDFLKESDVYMKYGELTVEHVIPGFSKIFVESYFTDVTLLFDSRSRFAFDILYHEKSVLRLPGEGIRTEDSSDGKEHFRTRGTMGGENPKSQVTINALQKCFINLSIK